ncbi:MAG: CHAP domain-containing protein [Polyangiaceae bacterium]|nr:CHAP domain-containing protein [Polyangiaceae bacterium]
MNPRALAAIASAAGAAGGFAAILLLSRRSFARELVAAAVEDLGVREDLGRNDGVAIRAFFRGWPVQPPANWCAAAATAWLRRAASRLRVPAPIPGSLKAKEIGAQLADLAAGGRGQWFGATELRARPELLQVGDLVVWDRSDPARPETAWQGHVGVVVDAGGVSFQSIEGNSGPVGDRVARMSRSLADPRLLGAGRAW